MSDVVINRNSDTTIDESLGLQNNDIDASSSLVPSALTDYVTSLGVTTTPDGFPQYALTGYDPISAGTGASAVTLTGSDINTVQDLRFSSDSSGSAFPTDGGSSGSYVDSGLDTVDGHNIYLFQDPTGQFLIGREGNDDGSANTEGDVVFLLYVQEQTNSDGYVDGGQIWITLFEPIYQPDTSNPDDAVDLTNVVYITADQSESFSADGAPSGQNLFIMFANAADTIGIVATGAEPANQSETGSISGGDTINTSSVTGTTFGVNKQMVSVGESLMFTFVNDPDPDYTTPNLDQNEADIEANIQFTGGAYEAVAGQFQVVQLQSGKAAALTLTAFESNDVGIVSSDPDNSRGAISGTDTLPSARYFIGTTEVLDATTGSPDYDALIAAINAQTTTTGVSASLTDGDLILSSAASFTLSGFGGISTALADGQYTSGTQFVDGILNGDPSVNITSVTVDQAGGTKQNPTVIPGDPVSDPGNDTPFTVNGLTYIFHDDGTVTIEGLEAGDTVHYTTDDTHNRLEILNQGTGDHQTSAAFDIGGFTLTNSDSHTLEVGSTINFQDDGLSVAGGSTQSLDEANLDNTQSVGTVMDSTKVDDNGNLIVVNNMQLLVTPSVDGPTVFSVNPDLSSLDSQALSSKGAAIVWSSSTGIAAFGTTTLNPETDLLSGSASYQIDVGSNSFSFTPNGTDDTLLSLIQAINGWGYAEAKLDGTDLMIQSATGDDLMITGFDGNGFTGYDGTYSWLDNPAVMIDSDPSDSLAALDGNQILDAGDYTIAVGSDSHTFTANGTTNNLNALVTAIDGLSFASAELSSDGDLLIRSTAPGPVHLTGFASISSALADGEYVAISGSVVSVDLGSSLTADFEPANGSYTISGQSFTIDDTTGHTTLGDLIDLINAGPTDATAALVGGQLVLESKDGAPLVLSGFDAAFGSGTDGTYDTTRDVADYQLAPSGWATFRVMDQFDHLGANDLALTVDFTGVLVAADPEGDTASLGTDFNSYTIFDDAPVLSGTSLSVEVDEDALGNQTADEASAGVPNDTGDQSLGNIDDSRPGETSPTAPDLSVDATSGSLAGLVTVGADEPATFSLISDTSSLESQTLTSRGATLVYDVSSEGDMLTAGVASIATSVGGLQRSTLLSGTAGSPVTFSVTDGTSTVDFTANGDDSMGDLIDAINATTFATAYLLNGDLVIDSLGGDTLTLTNFDQIDGTFGNSQETSTRTVFLFTLAANGDWTVNLQDQLDQPLHDTDPTSGLTGYEDVLTIAMGAMIKATDFDGDSVTLTTSDTVPVSVFDINVRDDIPVIHDTTDLVFANGSTGTGIFDYSIGADERGAYSATDSDFANLALTGTFGGVTIQNAAIDWHSEDSGSAQFGFSFEYQPNPSVPDPTPPTADGIITFDKIAGTYTVNFDNAFEGYVVRNTGSTQGLTGYNLQGSPQQPEVVVSQLDANFWVQFAGDHVTNGSNGTPLTAGGDTAFTDGDLFSAEQTYVSISNTQNGVAGDTIQSGEVLDLSFYTSDPLSSLSNDPGVVDGRADGVYLKFDNIGTTEDLLVVLKLVDEAGNTTTKTVVVDASDIVKDDSLLPSDLHITLDNNDGAVVIESNDYNFDTDANGTADYQIYGLQVLTSSAGLTGSGIDLNPDTGVSGGSAGDGTEAFGAATNDTDVVKISDIGFITEKLNTADANLNLSYNMVDADGDATATQTLGIVVEGSNKLEGGSTAESIVGTSADEQLIGNGGADILTGNGGADQFVFNAPSDGPDTITDFNSTEGDALVVSASGFGGGLAAGTLSSDAFFAADFSSSTAGAHDGTDRFVYDTSSGELWFDANGTTVNDSPELIATLTGAPSLDAGDILVIA